jgi:hypothetical protein
MSENWLSWYTTGIAATLLGLGSHLGMLHLAERSMEIANKDYGRFLALRSIRRKLEVDLDLEAWRWPIFARPVLYTEVDRTAQVHFSNVHRDIQRARDVEEKISPPPQRPSDLRHLLSFFHNCERYYLCTTIHENVVEMESILQTVSTQLNALEQSHRGEENLESATHLSLDLLKEKLEETGKRIKGKSQGDKYNENVNWSQIRTDNCLVEAQSQLGRQTPDGINVAIADTFIKLANYILEHFDLYERELETPARFELDHFEHHHTLFRKCIEEMQTGPIEEWYSLRSTARMLELVDSQMRRAIRSLDTFDEQENKLYRFEQKIQDLNLPGVIQSTQDLEKECGRYWKPIDQDPSIWVKVLERNQLPGTILDDARRSFQAVIFPSIGPDIVIKQSELHNIFREIAIFLQKVGLAKNCIKRLVDELAIHKSAEIQVNMRLSPTGTTGQRILDIALIEPDTTEQLQRQCMSCRHHFGMLQARAEAVEGANFPSMLGELDELEHNCIDIRQQHNAEIEALRHTSFELVHQLIAVHADIKQLKEKRPLIEYDVTEVSENIALLRDSYSQDARSIRDLRGYISQVRGILPRANKEKQQLESLWQEFEVVWTYSAGKLQALKEMLDSHHVHSLESWAWIQREYERPLRSGYGQHQKYARQLDRLMESNLTIKQASQMCKRLEEEILRESESIASQLEKIWNKQEVYANSVMELAASTKRTTMFSFAPKDSDMILNLCAQAAQSSSEQGVQLFLDLAQGLLKKTVTREEVSRQIHNYGIYNESQSVGSGGAAFNTVGQNNQLDSD